MTTKTYKCGFIADIKTVTLALKFPCLVSVLWKRGTTYIYTYAMVGQKTAQIKQRKQIDNGVVTFHEKLEIQCNMAFNSKTDKFEQKKTKFTVVILSDKGTKQAGEVYLDVSELLNEKSKKLKYQKNLQKCPDRNAKLTLQLSAYIKQQIAPDAISQSSNKSLQQQIAPVSTIQQQPNFKKKKKEALVVQHNLGQNITQQQKTATNKREKSAIPVTKQNIPKVQINALQQQNKKLKQNLRQLKQLQIDNENLRMQYETEQKKTRDYYSKKYEQLKLEYKQVKQKLQQIRVLKENKQSLEQQLYENKDIMAGILNYAVLNKKNDLAEQLTNIYSNEERL